jgi:hypothetical protein
MPTVRDILEAFDNRRFTEIDRFIQQIKSSRDGEVTFQPNEQQTRQTEADEAFPYLQDINSGPLTRGINNLHGTALVISGTSYSGIQTFGIYDFVYNPEQFKLADNDSGVLLTVTTLNMRDYFNLLKTINPVEYTEFRNFILKIFKTVKSGGFRKDVYSNAIRNRCKKVIKICLNYKQVV